jgi:hypothetical protein
MTMSYHTRSVSDINPKNTPEVILIKAESQSFHSPSRGCPVRKHGELHVLPGKRIIQIPRITKSTPAPILTKFGGISLAMTTPNRTLSKEVRTIAQAEPRNTETRDSVSAEKATVAT